MQDFTERSAKYTDQRLLSIIREADKYHAAAVDAARAEANRRGLVEETPIFSPEEEKASYLEQFGKHAAADQGPSDVLDWFGRPAVNDQRTRWIVYSLIGVLVLICLAGLYREFNFLQYLQYAHISEWDLFGIALRLGEPAMVLTTAYLVFRRVSLGYQLATILTGFAIIGLLMRLLAMYQINAEMGYSIGELLTMNFTTFLNTLAFAVFQLAALVWLTRHPLLLGYFGLPANHFSRYLSIGILASLLLRGVIFLIF